MKQLRSVSSGKILGEIIPLQNNEVQEEAFFHCMKTKIFSHVGIFTKSYAASEIELYDPRFAAKLLA